MKETALSWLGFRVLGEIRRAGLRWNCWTRLEGRLEVPSVSEKVLFPPVKSSSLSVVRIRTEFSVSNFATGGNCFLLNGPHCYPLSKEDSFSAQLAEKVFSLKSVQKAILC